MEDRKIWATLHPFVEHGDIMGRSVANQGFLNALLRADSFDEYHFFLPDERTAEMVSGELARRFPERHKDGAFRVRTRHVLPDAVAVEPYTVFHLSDCVADSVPLMRLRNALSREMFAITGTTHSLSYARYSLHFFDQIWPGVTERDAIIATSTAGREALRAMFSALRKGYALPDSFREPHIARIPLGIEPTDFPSCEEKPVLAAEAGKHLGIAEGHLTLLVFARISHYSKMDILPLLRMLARAERMGLPRGGYTLVLAGWMDTGDAAAAAYADIAASLGIAFCLVPSPDNALRKKLFALADMFLSPVDNPQETFGLTMLEAGISGVPVVASDFDGYRDLVVHEETGILVPTLGPAMVPETDALSGVWFDNQRHLQIAQQSIVSVPDFASAVARLAVDPDLRRRMGEAARKRILENYTWDHVLRLHMALWEELAVNPAPRPQDPHPLHPGYVEVFGGYYTQLLDRTSLTVRWTDFGEAVYRGRDYPAVYAGVERLVSIDALKRILFQARKPVPATSLLPGNTALPETERAAFLVLWALKQDLLERVSAE